MRQVRYRRVNLGQNVYASADTQVTHKQLRAILAKIRKPRFYGAFQKLVIANYAACFSGLESRSILICFQL